jgi:hypothetical protein
VARSGPTEWRSILASALRLPDMSTSKGVKMGAVSVRGDPTQALNENRDRMWADEVSSARIMILDVSGKAPCKVASGNARRKLMHIE